MIWKFLKGKSFYAWLIGLILWANYEKEIWGSKYGVGFEKIIWEKSNLVSFIFRVLVYFGALKASKIYYHFTRKQQMSICGSLTIQKYTISYPSSPCSLQATSHARPNKFDHPLTTSSETCVYPDGTSNTQHKSMFPRIKVLTSCVKCTDDFSSFLVPTNIRRAIVTVITANEFTQIDSGNGRLQRPIKTPEGGQTNQTRSLGRIPASAWPLVPK